MLFKHPDKKDLPHTITIFKNTGEDDRNKPAYAETGTEYTHVFVEPTTVRKIESTGIQYHSVLMVLIDSVNSEPKDVDIDKGDLIIWGSIQGEVSEIVPAYTGRSNIIHHYELEAKQTGKQPENEAAENEDNA